MISELFIKLQQLRAADPECRGFGTETHRYQLGPILSASELQMLENRYAIELPQEFAAFLHGIGNGGAGPGYGLQRFGYLESVRQVPTGIAKGPERLLQKTRNGSMYGRDMYDQAGHKISRFDVSYFDLIKGLAGDGAPGPRAPSRQFSLMEPIQGEQDDRWESFEPRDGTLFLADYGCGIGAHLILNGPFKGQVWLTDPNTGFCMPFAQAASLHYPVVGCESETDRNSIFTFASWYEHWLDHALTGIQSEYE